MIKWKRIVGFPKYEISREGVVRNIKSGRLMVYSPNQFGDLTVGLMKDGKQYRRSVKVLVAKAFVEVEDDRADTAVLLDGDKNNVSASNIVWRPRWFAWEYTHQFELMYSYYDLGPIRDRTGNVYPTIFDCAKQIGSLCAHIRKSLHEGTRVYPGGEVFSWD